MLLKLAEDRRKALNDLHILLKLVKTLPMIEKYQQENLPSEKPIEALIRQYDKLIREADAATKK
jgi:hypothetical protein